MKTTPYATILDGIMDYLPPLSKQETTRLPSLYSVSAQSQGENGIQAELTYAIDKRNNFDFNVSYQAARQYYSIQGILCRIQ